MAGREWSCESRGGADADAAGAERATAIAARRHAARLTGRDSSLRHALKTHMSSVAGRVFRAVGFALALGLLPAAAHAATKPPTLVKTEQLDPRLQELTFTTPA